MFLAWATVQIVTTSYPFDHYEVEAGGAVRKHYALGGQRVAMGTDGALSRRAVNAGADVVCAWQFDHSGRGSAQPGGADCESGREHGGSGWIGSE